MDKREFLKFSGALVTGSLLSRLAVGHQSPAARTNWSGNYEYHARQLLMPIPSKKRSKW